MGVGDIDDGGSKLAANGDDDTTITLDALDAANDTCELALGDLNLATGLAGVLEVLEEDNLLVGLGGDALIVVHALVGHEQDLVVTVEPFVEGGVHDETQRLEELLVALDLHELGEGGTDEEVVQQVGGEVHLGHADTDEAERGVGIENDVLFLQMVLLLVETVHHELQSGDAGVPDAHGEPVQLVLF